jgi:hypothetical protein
MIYLLLPLCFGFFFKWKLEQWEYKKYKEANPPTKIKEKDEEE